MRRLAIIVVALVAAAAACSDDAPSDGDKNEGNNGAGNNGVDNNGALNNGVNNGANNGVNNGENNGANNGENNGQNNGQNNGGPACPDGTCDEGEDNANCPADCPPEPICDAGDTRCVNPRTVETCSEDGAEWTVGPCAVGEVCVADACLPVTCRPGDVLRCASQTEIVICDETGTGEALSLCDPTLFCDYLNGEYLCTDQICDPGQTRCAGLVGIEMCAEDGTTWIAGDLCASGTQCDNGACRSLCEINSKVSSFLGCEYYSADFDNIEGGTNAPHAVIISNPNDIDVEIEVSDAHGEPVTVDEWPLVVPAGELAIWFFRGGAINTHNNQGWLLFSASSPLNFEVGTVYIQSPVFLAYRPF